MLYCDKGEMLKFRKKSIQCFCLNDVLFEAFKFFETKATLSSSKLMNYEDIFQQKKTMMHFRKIRDLLMFIRIILSYF